MIIKESDVRLKSMTDAIVVIRGEIIYRLAENGYRCRRHNGSYYYVHDSVSDQDWENLEKRYLLRVWANNGLVHEVP